MINIHGVTAAIESEIAPIINLIAFDFGDYFNRTNAKSNTAQIFATVKNAPPYGINAGDEIGRISGGVTFRVNDGRKLFQYEGGIFCLWDAPSEHAIFWCNSATPSDLEIGAMYEKIYLFISSRIGEKLEQQHFFRIHGFGISYGAECGIIGLSPSGGGKSTFVNAVLQKDGVRLFSDDTPLLMVDQNGQLLMQPLKLRLGFLSDTDAGTIPAEDRRIFTRRQRADKILVTPKSKTIPWGSNPIAVKHCVVLKFTKNSEPRLEDLSGIGLFFVLFRDLIIGYGLPQVVEFFLTNGFASIVQKIPLIFQRTILAIRICFSASGSIFHQSESIDKNVMLFTQKFLS